MNAKQIYKHVDMLKCLYEKYKDSLYLNCSTCEDFTKLTLDEFMKNASDVDEFDYKDFDEDGITGFRQEEYENAIAEKFTEFVNESSELNELDIVCNAFLRAIVKYKDWLTDNDDFYFSEYDERIQIYYEKKQCCDVFFSDLIGD